MNRTVIVGLLKDWGLALAITLVVLGLWRAFSPGPPESGPAPALTLSDTAGQEFTLDGLTEDVVVLNFWTTWCGPCRAEIPALARYHSTHPEVGLYGVSVDVGMDPRRLDDISNRLGVTYPVLHDNRGTVAKGWGVTVYPTTFVLDNERQIVASHMGPLSGIMLDRMVRSALTR